MSTLRGEQPSRLSPCTHPSRPAPWQGSVLPQTTPPTPAFAPAGFCCVFWHPEAPVPTVCHGHRHQQGAEDDQCRVHGCCERGERGISTCRRWGTRAHGGTAGNSCPTTREKPWAEPPLPPVGIGRRANTRQPQILVPRLCPGHPRARRLMGGEGCAGKGCSRQAACHFPWICAVF